MRAGALRNFPGQWAPAPPTGLSDAGHEARALRGHSPAGLLEPEQDTGAVAGGAPGRRPPALAHRHSRRRAKAGVRPGLSGALGAKNVTGADLTVGFAHRAPARCSGAGSARRGDSGADTWQGPGHTGRCLSDPPRPRAHTEPQCAWGLRAQPSTDIGERLWALGPVADRSWFSKKIVRLLLFFKSGDLGGRTPQRKPAGREHRTAGLAGRALVQLWLPGTPSLRGAGEGSPHRGTVCQLHHGSCPPWGLAGCNRNQGSHALCGTQNPTVTGTLG